MITLEDYLPVVGNEVVANLHAKARRLYGKRIIHVNSTYQGGGVAEMLERLVPLMNDIGLEADWRILPGPLDFFNITKRFHNGLQGEDFELTDEMRDLYVSQNGAFSDYAKLDAEAVIIHDPQPLPLIRFYQKRQPWLWRCHIDLTEPHGELWDFLTQFILRYDTMIVSSEDYRRADLWLQQVVFTPAIDPLSLKNQPMDRDVVEAHLATLGVPQDKPYILQVSRFDKWKDMEGVLNSYRIVRGEFPCRVVLCGSMAADDPEGLEMYQRIIEDAADLLDQGEAIIITDASNAEVNALQRGAAVIMQKSKREGFGLTVTEGMWKARPVVATRVGGIPLQIDDMVGGLLVQPGHDEDFAAAVLKVLQDDSLAAELGYHAREKVRQDFLITRLLSAYLDLLNDTLA